MNLKQFMTDFFKDETNILVNASWLQAQFLEHKEVILLQDVELKKRYSYIKRLELKQELLERKLQRYEENIVILDIRG